MNILTPYRSIGLTRTSSTGWLRTATMNISRRWSAMLSSMQWRWKLPLALCMTRKHCSTRMRTMMTRSFWPAASQRSKKRPSSVNSHWQRPSLALRDWGPVLRATRFKTYASWWLFLWVFAAPLRDHILIDQLAGHCHCWLDQEPSCHQSLQCQPICCF